MSEIRQKQELSYYADIYIAGDLAMIRHLCRKICMEGLCVTITATEFVYTGGMEAGARIGLVNYPRFPTSPEELEQKAIDIAHLLIEGLHQHSALVQTPNFVTWLTRRPQGMSWNE